MDLTFLLTKLQTAPTGFGFNDLGAWLQDIPQIDQLASIEAIFNQRLTKQELLALFSVLTQKYLKEGPAYNLFDDHLQQYAKQNTVEDVYKVLTLYGDKSKHLDFSVFSKNLSKLLIDACKEVTTITLPTSKKLEALVLSDLPALTEVNQLTQLRQLRYLAINRCPLLTDISFIKQLKQLVWLDLSANKQLPDLHFLMPSHQIAILQLLDTTLLDNPKNIKWLRQLKQLKYLTISGKQTQIAQLRELLPQCLVNGMTAVNQQAPMTMANH